MQSNKKFTIYISRSMLTDVFDVSVIALNFLRQYPNVKVTYYDKNQVYDSKLVSDADIVLSLSHKPTEHITHGYMMGKGQCSEIELANRLDIPVYRVDSDSNDTVQALGVHILNPKDWKLNYATSKLSISVLNIIEVINQLINKEDTMVTDFDELLLITQIIN